MNKPDTIIPVTQPAKLMDFLIANLRQKSRDNIKSLLRNRQVWISGRSVSQFDHPLQPGQQVMVKWARAGDTGMYHYLGIVYEDESLVVIDKQAGVLSISTGKEHLTAYSLLSHHVKLQDPANKIFVVHRLDRETSGLMMFARSEKVQELLQKDWQTNVRERTYFALVEGTVNEPFGTVRSYLAENKAFVMHASQDPSKGELAITHFKTTKAAKNYSLLEVNLETGKKNQIRVHMQEIGHPVAGDKKYGAVTNPIGRLGLHAGVLAFSHPVSGETLRFTSPVPPKFLRVF